jgi:hypothetical protein
MKPIKPLKRTITNTNGLKYWMRRFEIKEKQKRESRREALKSGVP